ATRTLNQGNSSFTESGTAFTSTSTGLFFNFGSSVNDFAYFLGNSGGLTCLVAFIACGNVSIPHAWSIQPNFNTPDGTATFSALNSNVQIASVGVSAV